MRRVVLLATISVIFLTNIFTLSSDVSKAEVRADTVLYVDPSSVQVLPATEFTVSIIVKDVVDLMGFDIYLGFNSSILDVLSVIRKNPWDGLTGNHEVNDLVGYVRVYSALLGPPFFSGKSTLFTVTFNATIRGQSALDLYITDLANSDAAAIPHTSLNGFVTVYNTVTVPDDYLTIQAAINAAGNGDTVFIRNGTYIENVVVNKSLSLLGEDKETTVVDGDGVGTVIQVDSDNVTIRGLQVRGCSMEWGNYGIILKASSNSIISRNIMRAVYAICVEKGSRNSITDNDFVGDDGSCIFHGLQLVNSSGNVVSNNNLSVNCHCALSMYNSSNNMVSFNYISGHFVPFPFTIEKSSNNSIVGNTMWQPAPLFGGHIYFNESKGNAFYHNSFLAEEGPNTLSVDELSTNNTWDNGYEGNYWSNYEERYPNSSYDRFGIWDTPYIIDENNQDNYPLRNPYWNPADTNHDLIVDIFDIVLAAGCYCLDWQDHYAHVDIAEPYGIVDIFDIVMMASQYGEEYTP